MAKKNIKFFIIAFLLSFSLWGGVNFLFSKQIPSQNQLTAQLVSKKELNLEAKAAISLSVKESGEEKILFQKNIDEKLPIASLTKLMTADIVLENYEPQEKSINLLYSMLIESNNEAADALADIAGKEKFVQLMNEEAKNLGMADTHFANPSGIDNPLGFSTAGDLTKLTKHLFAKPLIWEILSLKEYDIYKADGSFDHKATTTNELLGKIPSILGGKTGETPNALGCLLLVLRAPDNSGYIINVILGSESRFSEMEKLIEWQK